MSDLQTLMDMGFTQERASRALEVTNNKGVEPAMEWLLAHIDEVIPENSGVTPGSETLVLKSPVAAAGTGSAENMEGSSSSSVDAVAESTESVKSLKCNDCHRLFQTQTDMEYHAAKTGHINFSESTEEKRPLTEDEKKEQLAKLEEKLKKKRVERDEREKSDELERERLRIKSGKDMSEARRKMEEMEMKKIVEQRKREKADEKLARDRVKLQIEADKAARKARVIPELEKLGAKSIAAAAAAKESELAAAAAAAAVSTTAQLEQPNVASPSTAQYVRTKIQVRLQNGNTCTETFNVKEQLAAVRLFIQLKQGVDTPFALMTSFPRKVFVEEDYETPLDVLGLVPSAVIIVTKPT